MGQAGAAEAAAARPKIHWTEREKGEKHKKKKGKRRDESECALAG